MFDKRWFAVASMAVLLTACGGGGKDKELSRGSGVLLLVNGSSNISDMTLNKLTLTTSNAGSNFERCTETKLLDGGAEYEQNLYDNNNSLDAQYCDQTRESLATIVQFQIRFFNNTYDDMPITYKGVGVTVRIYDDANDDGVYDPNEEVWNSIVAQDQSNQSNKFPAFDPNAEFSRVLGPAEAFPYQKSFAFTYYFTGDQNYLDSDGDPDTYLLENDFVGVGWIPGDLDRTASQCTPGALEAGTTTDLVTKKIIRYKRPLCQTVPLAAGTYHVIVDYSFTPAQPSVEFNITINPES